MNNKSILFLITSLISTCIAFSDATYAVATKVSFPSNSISLEQVTKDVTYLASDGLKGRANFSTELSHAAHYIAERFKENGLVGINKEVRKNALKDYLQTYQVSTITPNTLTVILNNQAITTDNLAIASTAKNITWQTTKGLNSNDFILRHINKNDDMRAVLSQLNNKGGNYLVLVNSTHEKIFHRYQHYFQRGVTKLTEDEHKKPGGTIIMVFTDTAVEDIKNINISGFNDISMRELTNVVAILPGKAKPNEVVLYSAHYDHLGTTDTRDTKADKSKREDNIYNGADDDASGTAAIINIAQYYAKKNDNARTLIFTAFSAEEIGGFGSQYFSKQLDPKTIIAMINIEMIGKPSKFGEGTLWMTGMERSNLGAQLNYVLAKHKKEIHPDPYPEQGLFYRSDNSTLAKLGVPAHSFSSTQLDKDQHYHQVSDDLASLNLPSLHQVIETLAIATQPLVNGSVTPSRIDTSKIKTKGVIF